MAEGGLQDLQESLTCSLCTDLFDNPRILPCQHAFCSECLKQHLETWTKEGIISCPYCRGDTAVPKTGVEGFPKAFNYTNQVQIYKHLQQQLYAAASRPRDSDISPKPLNTACKYHHKEFIEVCENCNQLICDSCSELPHKTHLKAPLKSVVPSHRSYLEGSQKRLKEQTTAYEKRMQETKQAAEFAKKQKDESLMEIKKQTDELHKIIDDFRQQLSSEVIGNYEKANEKLKELMKKQESEKFYADDYLQRLDKCLADGTEAEIVRSSLEDAANIEGTIQELIEAQKQSVPGFSVDVSCLPVSSLGTELVATVKCQYEAAGHSKYYKPQTLVASKTKEFQLGYHPTGVCFTPDGNIIVCEYSEGKVSIYNHEGHKVVDLQTPHGARPWDAECTLNHIYVTDRSTESVMVFTLDGAFVTSFKVDNVSGIAGISKLSNYTVPMYIVGTGSHTVHEIQRSQARTQNKFATGLQLNTPYFVCARGRSLAISSYVDHCVYVTDLTGNLKYRYGTPGQVGVQKNLLLAPLGVAFDSANRLFIANGNGAAISVLSDQGEYIGSIDLKLDNVAGPHGIAISDQDELVVASHTNKSVVIYKSTIA